MVKDTPNYFIDDKEALSENQKDKIYLYIEQPGSITHIDIPPIKDDENNTVNVKVNYKYFKPNN